MSYYGEVDLGPSFQPFVFFREQFGYVPNLLRAQSLLPKVIEAEAALISAVLLKKRVLSRIQKESVLLVLAAADSNPYCFTAHHQMLLLLGVPGKRMERIIADYRKADLSAVNSALLGFALKLGPDGPSLQRREVTEALEHLGDESMLEAILTAALAGFLSTLATGLGATPDFSPIPIPQMERPLTSAGHPDAVDETPGPFLRVPEPTPTDGEGLAFYQDVFGLIPNVFRAQVSMPDVLEAESALIRAILLTESALTRVQKEQVSLSVSTANRSTYWVAFYCGLGHPPAESDSALLDFAVKLGTRPGEFGPSDIDSLVHQGWKEAQILEAVVVTALTKFLNTLQFGIGSVPDFAPEIIFQPKKAHLSGPDSRPTDLAIPEDPDADCVARVRNGDLEAFEELMNRHSRRIYRTLVGILGNPEEARDAMQDTFLKAFQHLGSFERRSKFSTWLVSIASNTGIQRLRERRPWESLDDTGAESEEGFRPRQVQAWTDDPEKLYSQTEMRSLIEKGVMKLPAKYRVVLVLRDIEQLPMSEVAASLELRIPALKARLLRGRLMLREALALHFSRGAKGVTL